MNTAYDDTAPWQSVDETDDEEILVAASPGRGRPRTVTFNEEKNETTLITPRGAKKQSQSHPKESPPNNYENNDSYDLLEDQLPKATHYETPHQEHLPRPKQYSGRADLRWVKSRTDSGGMVAAQEEGGKSVGRKGSGRGGGAQRGGEGGRGQCVPMVSVAFYDDLHPEPETPTTPKPGDKTHKKGAEKKGRRSHPREEVETVMSTMALSDDEEQGGEGADKTEWATPGSLTTKVVSGGQKNYYELALQARMAKHRFLHQQQQVQEDSTKKTKTIKTFEFGDGEVIEHKTVSTVDPHSHHKKEYVLPKEARPHSAVKAKPQEVPVITVEDEGQAETADHQATGQAVKADTRAVDREEARRRNVNLGLGAEYDARLKPTAQPTSGRPSSGRLSSGRPSTGRPSSGRPSSGRPSSGRPTSARSNNSRPTSSNQSSTSQPVSIDIASLIEGSFSLKFNIIEIHLNFSSG